MDERKTDGGGSSRRDVVLLNHPVPSKSDPVLPYSARTSFYCARSCAGRIFYGFQEIMVGSKSRPRAWFICPNNGGGVQYVRCQCRHHDSSDYPLLAPPQKPQQQRQLIIQSDATCVVSELKVPICKHKNILSGSSLPLNRSRQG